MMHPFRQRCANSVVHALYKLKKTAKGEPKAVFLPKSTEFQYDTKIIKPAR
jgi:hypothetical protein